MFAIGKFILVICMTTKLEVAEPRGGSKEKAIPCLLIKSNEKYPVNLSCVICTNVLIITKVHLSHHV